MTKKLLRTIARNELTDVPERGSRFWSTAEIMTPTWFVVEVSCQHLDSAEIRRWVTASFHDATQIQQSCRPYLWAQIYVCLRAPLSVRSGIIFEVINEAHVLPGSGNVVFHLANGLSFQSHFDDPVTGLQKPAAQVDLIYARKQNGSPLA